VEFKHGDILLLSSDGGDGEGMSLFIVKSENQLIRLTGGPKLMVTHTIVTLEEYGDRLKLVYRLGEALKELYDE